jgi:hypothetical protein
MTTIQYPTEYVATDLRKLGVINGAQYATAPDGRELRLKGNDVITDRRAEPLRPDQVAVRFTHRSGYYFHRATVVEKGTYAERMRAAKAKTELLRNPPRRAVDALTGVSGLFNRHMASWRSPQAQRLPMADLIGSLKAAGIGLTTVKGKLKVIAPEGRLSPEQAEVLTRCETLIVAQLDGKPLKCWLCNKADAVTYAVPSLPVCAACLAKEA